MTDPLNKRAGRPSHGLVVAYLALFLTLAGTAIAAATIGSGDVINGSIKSIDLKDNGGVKGVDVRNRSLGGGDVAAGSLRASDFRGNSVAGADISEATLDVERIYRRLGGAVNLPLTTGVAHKLLPNNDFTQAADESDQIIAGGQMTFAASCMQPRTFTAYLLLDDPLPSPGSFIGLVQLQDEGTGAVTRVFDFGGSPFPGSSGMKLFRTGTAVNHQVFIWAGVNCNSGGGATIDSAQVNVIGHR